MGCDTLARRYRLAPEAITRVGDAVAIASRQSRTRARRARLHGGAALQPASSARRARSGSARFAAFHRRSSAGPWWSGPARLLSCMEAVAQSRLEKGAARSQEWVPERPSGALSRVAGRVRRTSRGFSQPTLKIGCKGLTGGLCNSLHGKRERRKRRSWVPGVPGVHARAPDSGLTFWRHIQADNGAIPRLFPSGFPQAVGSSELGFLV